MWSCRRSRCDARLPPRAGARVKPGRLDAAGIGALAGKRKAPYRPPVSREEARIKQLEHEVIVLRHAAAILLDAVRFDRSPLSVQAARRAQESLRQHGYREIALL